jgi:endonuclease III
MTARIAPAELVKKLGGRYARALGVDLAAQDTHERFKWFLAAMLYGARISESLATRTWHEFAARNVLTPERIVKTGWDGLVGILDDGGYVRYDYKTATKLLNVCNALIRDYGGSLDTLHGVASGPRDLEDRLKALGKGIGDTTVSIFLRELRGIWAKADPPLSPLALAAALALGYLRSGSHDAGRALSRLRDVWTTDGQPAAGFADFESALVREGLRLRHLAARRHAAKS